VQDSLGKLVGVSSDSINVIDTTPPVAMSSSTVARRRPKPERQPELPSTSADVTQVDISNSPTMAGLVTRALGLRSVEPQVH